MSLKLPFRFSTLYLSISKSSFKPITAFPLLNSYAHVHHRHITTTTMASTTPVKNLALTSTLTLQNSPSHTEIPHIGFGVYKSPPEVCVSSVLHAIKTGYRQIDTAQFYANESEVGEAIAKSEIPRSELYVTTKVIAYSGSFEKSYQECVKSVRKIGGEGGYVDLFLIHTPSMGPEKRKELWKALEKLKDEGLAKDIGVSNFGTKHIDEVFSYGKHKPVINQIELHPWCQQPALVNYCRSKNIVLQAYAPLVRAQKMSDPVLTSIADAHSVSPGQVLIRWSLQRGFIPLPKSDQKERIEKNADVYGFELSEEEMGRLNDLGKGLEDGEGAICPYNVHCP